MKGGVGEKALWVRGVQEQDTEAPPKQRPTWEPLSVEGWEIREVMRQEGE